MALGADRARVVRYVLSGGLGPVASAQSSDSSPLRARPIARELPVPRHPARSASLRPRHGDPHRRRDRCVPHSRPKGSFAHRSHERATFGIIVHRGNCYTVEKVIVEATPPHVPPRPPPRANDEGQLVARARSGDAAAFTDLVNRYERKIYRLAKHITQNDEDAEDVLQDAFPERPTSTSTRSRAIRNSTPGSCASPSTKR